MSRPWRAKSSIYSQYIIACLADSSVLGCGGWQGNAVWPRAAIPARDALLLDVLDHASPVKCATICIDDGLTDANFAARSFALYGFYGMVLYVHVFSLQSLASLNAIRNTLGGTGMHIDTCVRACYNLFEMAGRGSRAEQRWCCSPEPSSVTWACMCCCI